MLLSDLSVMEEENAGEVGHKVLEHLQSTRVVRLTAIGSTPADLRAFYDDLVDTIGQSANTSEHSETGDRLAARWTDVRYDPRLRDLTYRHSLTHQPLHTDAAYDDTEGDLVLMYCERQAPSGGATTFIDGADLIAVLQRDESTLYARLLATPVRFSKTDRSRTRPIISFDEHGPVLTWNYFRVDEGAPTEVKRLAEDFHRFLEDRVVGSDIEAAIRLKPGEAVIWQDERVLHGRAGFTATDDGDRLLWKAPVRVRTQVRSSAPDRRT